LNGNEILSDIVIHDKYANYLKESKRRETWTEIIMRSAEMDARKYPELEKEIYEVYANFVLPKKVVPSMRKLQFAGKPIELSPNRMYNCAFLAMDNYRAFSETMFLLLGGSGVGYSVQARHIEKLPSISPPKGTIRYVIQDSIVGWSDAIKTLMKAHFMGGPKPRFDLRDIRPKGARLVTSGGKAPGPVPLEDALMKITRVLEGKNYGEKLTPIEVFDIQCYIAEAVLAGGIRRSATICLFDKFAEEMLTSKTGEWWITNPQRAMANISAVLHRGETTKDEFEGIFRRTKSSGSGEPGFVWTYDYELGVNPCAEISLKSMGFCNLTEVNGSNIKDIEDLESRVEAATFLGTLQAGYTDFYYLRPEWQKNAVEEALLGVSITGIASLEWLNENDLKQLGGLVREENNRVSKLIGINSAKRTTCVKPSGTTSLVVGSSSGIHAWYAPYYIRRMRLNKTEALYSYIKNEIPELIEDDYLRPHDTAVLSVPMKSPEGAVLRNESAIDTLNRVIKYAENWVQSGHNEGLNKHNVSCTINVKPDEWDQVQKFMWDNRKKYTGISLLPYDNGTYQQAPFEECDAKMYNKLTKLVRSIDLTKVIEDDDQTDLSGEVACGGGNCEIK